MPRTCLTLLACVLLSSCASVVAPVAIDRPTQRLQADVPHLHVPRPGLITGGQPAVNAWRDLGASGVVRVINLRPAAELGIRDEAAEVAAGGMDYVQIDVAGPEDLTQDKAAQLWHALDAGSGTVLVHCASGNRAGALLALAAAQAGGMSPEEALEFGQAAGLTKLEPAVRQRLGAGREASP